MKRYCLVETLLDGCSSIDRLIRSIVITVMVEPSQPAYGAGWTPPPKRVKAIDPHRHGLKQLLDQITLTVVELAAQLTPGEGGQIPAGVDEKSGICDLVFGGESVAKHRPQNAKRSDGLHESLALVNVGGSPWFSESVCVQFQIAPWERSTSVVPNCLP